MLFQNLKTEILHLVYPAADEAASGAAVQAAELLGTAWQAKIKAVPDSKLYENEILFGKVDRPTAAALSLNLCGEDAFLAGIWEGKTVILADDRLGMAAALYRLMRSPKGQLTPADNCFGRCRDLPRNEAFYEIVRMARKMWGTYGSWLQKKTAELPDEDRTDVALTDALIACLGNALVLCLDSSSALWRGEIVKTDRKDYTKVTKQTEAGTVLMASELAARYFGVPKTEDGYFNLTEYIENNPQFTLSVCSDRGLVIVWPADACGFDCAQNGGFSEEQLLQKASYFFNNPTRPEPTVAAEGTRRELIWSQFGTKDHYDYTEVTYDNYYSPAVLIQTNETGEKIIYAAHEISRLKNHKETSTVTCLKRSTDGGDTWRTLAYVADMRWAALTELGGRIYLMGNQSSGGSAMIAEWNPANESLRTAVLGLQVMGSAPCAVAVANDRIYRAHNGFVISAPTDSDLLDASSWTVSNAVHPLLSRETYERVTGKKTDPDKRFWLEEGNVVVGPDGQICLLYRIDASPTWGHAALLHLSPDGKVASVPAGMESPVIDFPSNQSKFMIKRDPKTGNYITFVSLPTADFTHQRNVLGMLVSEDLIRWRVADTVLVDRQMMNDWLSIYAHAYQYADFDFDGDDIVLIVREATGDTCVYHDGICVTLYTVADYAERL